MPAENDQPVHHLLLTGRRNGRYKQVIGFARVLDDDFTRTVLEKMTWSRTRSGYAFTNVRRPDGRYERVFLHRLVHEHYHGPVPPGLVLDHRDRDKANNLPANLQAVTRSVNAANKGLTRKNRSGYVGVSWSQPRGLWVATVKQQGRQTYLGAYTDPAEAARRVNAAFRETYPQIPVPNLSVELAVPAHCCKHHVWLQLLG